MKLIGVENDLVLFGDEEDAGGHGCIGADATLLDGATGRTVFDGGQGPCLLLPRQPVVPVITDRGAAWITTSSRDGRDRLGALRGHRVEQLDEGPAGTITHLRETERGIAWRSGGEERQADL